MPTTLKWPLITKENPKSLIAESYKGLRTNIDFSRLDAKVKSIIVTSATLGEGKSTTVANLAIAYAETGRSVLIIDGDLRNPAMHRIFNISNNIGLSNVLFDKDDLSKAIQSTRTLNLSVMTSGAVPPNPSEILGSKRMEALMEEVKSEYDLVILDTPPLLPFTDAQVATPLCEGVVMVIKAGGASRKDIVKATASLEFVGAHVLGAVLNQASRKTLSTAYHEEQ
ncbi:CpsD/CapB family tyrosine-protein kinase [Paenibacillus sp. PK4536]|uniref:non-specific protein-tyrosine kinase n=1 Tax=Paenibacillus nuruki TaxID=1886670 RepID=A0A1E3KZK1_9BACL|nr:MULTISPECIES: CpsD/CapB family tyrosine-protein kinase [Paenibacillus]ODP26345.1 putative tyrosine-protein kinase YveL [Paenibacillus nuruki]TKJ88293.1 capsular biosynthesis protein [Paenibacillus sp. CFBP13512]WIM40780.1 CpsD/CapB family tyrosine-protein kinase [Paenibacillus sp. PK4536]CAJ1316866.1 non-specific protein-tyrosine kinase [Paenibacillus nuruki]